MAEIDEEQQGDAVEKDAEDPGARNGAAVLLEIGVLQQPRLGSVGVAISRASTSSTAGSVATTRRLWAIRLCRSSRIAAAAGSASSRASEARTRSALACPGSPRKPSRALASAAISTAAASWSSPWRVPSFRLARRT